MDKHLKLKDILPYFNGDDEVLQVSTDGWDSEVCDIFHADSRLLRVFSDWDIIDMGAIGESVFRVVIKKIEQMNKPFVITEDEYNHDKMS